LALCGWRGKACAAKAKSLDGLPGRKPAVSKFPAMWPREPRLAAGAVSERQRQSQSLWILQRSAPAKRAAAKTSRVFGRPNDWVWMTIRRVRRRWTGLGGAQCCASSGWRWKPSFFRVGLPVSVSPTSHTPASVRGSAPICAEYRRAFSAGDPAC
jgi:hypothetical protein